MISIFPIITARAGSKRLPGKNSIQLAGKPLITWSIEAARQSGFVSQVVVSTDSDKIAQISKDAGAYVPFIRPDYLSDDTASSFDVVKHAIDFMKEFEFKTYDFVMLLQPTSPLRTANDIIQAIELLESKKADAVVSVCETEHSPLWQNTLPSDLSMSNFLNNEYAGVPSQQLPIYYRLNGAIYICRMSRFLEEKTFFIKDKIFAYVMPSKRSVDIDTAFDLKLAEVLLTQNL